MKKSLVTAVGSLFSLLCIITIATTAVASTEVVVVNVYFEVARCDSSVSTMPCDSAASVGEDVAIQPSNCSIVSGENICTGVWSDSKTRDGYPFDASISANRTTHADGTTSFSLNATVGQTLNSSVQQGSLDLYLAKGVISDSARITGSALRIDGTTYSYSPSLLIGPAIPRH